MRSLTERLTTSSLSESLVPQPPEQGNREQGSRNRETPGVSPQPSSQSLGDSTAVTKHCRTCDRTLPSDAFYTNRRNRDQMQSKCKECTQAYNADNRGKIRDWQKGYVAANPDVLRRTPHVARAHQLRKFGLTPEQYDQMHDAQNGLCAICRQPETSSSRPGGRVRVLAVDHNHETGEVRGLLCGRCNRGLGLFGDDSDRLRAAALYLDATSATMDGRYAAVIR